MSGAARLRALGLGGLAVLAAPTGAAPIEFSGEASLSGGYATNPFLQPGENGGALSIGTGISPRLTKRETNAVTTLAGGYGRTDYVGKGFDPSESFGLSLSRQQTFSARLSGSATLAYENSRNSFAQPDDIVDTTTLGARRKSYSASGSLQWQATQRDLLSASASATKAEYGGFGLGDYDSYSGSVVYRRVLNGQTDVGVSMSVSRTNSDNSGDTTTYSPRLVLDHEFDEVWTFNGSLGILFQRTTFNRPPLANFHSSSKGVGFDASLCRRQPRSSLCFTANRDTTASGLGGARTATQAAVSYSYELSARETLTASVSVADSKAVDRTFLVPKERYLSADVGYRRQISRRLDAGVSGAYRRRDLSKSPGADGFTASLNLFARIGRLR